MKALGIATLSQLNYVVYDIETTGLSRTKDRLTQIAGIRMQGREMPQGVRNRLKKIDPLQDITNDPDIFNILIDPKRSIPRKIQELTGLTPTILKGRSTEKNALQSFMSFSGDRILVAHNGINFDTRHIEAATARAKLPVNNLLCFDTLWLSRKLHPEERSHKLDSVMERWNVNPTTLGQRHNALVDVYLTCQVFSKMLKHLNKNDMDKLFVL